MAARAGRPVNLWRINDAKANRHGPRHKIAFVRRNPNYAESVKQGKPEHAFKTGKTYAGDWVNNKREGFGAQVRQDRTPFSPFSPPSSLGLDSFAIRQNSF